MKHIIVNVSRETREVNLPKAFISVDGENLQSNLIFKFEDEFVNGQGRLEYRIGNIRNYIILDKEEESYTIPVKNVITKEGKIYMQLVITEPSNDYKKTKDTQIDPQKIYYVYEEGIYRAVENPVVEDIEEYYELVNIPVFKSNTFYLVCRESINAVTEAPDGYELWIERANAILNQMDNIDIDAERVEDGVEITITKKDGTTYTKTIYDGEQGPVGPQGPQGPQGPKGDASDYGLLDNKPQINGVELVDNKSLDDLGIDQDFVKDDNYIHTDNNFTNEQKNKLAGLQNYNDTQVRNLISQNSQNITLLQGDVEDIGTEIDTIDSKIPNQATAQNQLADKNFVNSSIATNTAYFRGTYQSVNELPLTGNTPNDYAFVIIYDEVITTQVKQYDRYKWNSTQWVYEYTLNNSSFTANQWEAINSGITSENVSKLIGIEAGAEVNKVDDVKVNGTSVVDENKVANIEIVDIMSAINHRNIYRGKNLGSSVTQAQKTAIQNGTFDDLFIGDYWVINGVNWTIADMDYWYDTGDIPFTKHHLVIVPASNLYNAVMNGANTAYGGYTGSKMYTEGLDQAKTAFNDAFGDMVLSHREYLINAVVDGHASAGAWFDSTVSLMNEIMVYGCMIRAQTNNNSISSVITTTNSKQQLALYRLNTKALNTLEDFWLRDVVSVIGFALVGSYGSSAYDGASISYGVRPCCAIG